MTTQRSHKSKAKVNISGFKSLRKAIKLGLLDTSSAANNEYSRAFDKVAEIYRAFLRRNFRKNSRGKGGWAPIKPSTKRWRRGKVPKDKPIIKHARILEVSKALLHTTLTKYSPGTGQYQKRTKYGITLGIAADSHPYAEFTIQRLAEIHANGEGNNNPKRQIVIEADAETLSLMQKKINIAHKKEVAKANKAAKVKK